MSRRVAAAAVALTAIALVACGGPAGEQIPGVRPGALLLHPDQRPPAPTAAGELLRAEQPFSLTELAGRVVVVNFWASWCGPCRAEQPELNALYERFADGDVAIVGVNVQDARANALAYLDEFDVPYDSIYDPDVSFTAQFEDITPQALPTTLVLDRRGRVAIRLFGATNAEELTAVIQRLLDE